MCNEREVLNIENIAFKLIKEEYSLQVEGGIGCPSIVFDVFLLSIANMREVDGHAKYLIKS